MSNRKIWNIGAVKFDSEADGLRQAILEPEHAQYSAICPLCSKFVAHNRSVVVRLPTPMVPRGDGRRSSDDGGLYYADGQRIDMRPRSRAHLRCAKRYLKVITS